MRPPVHMKETRLATIVIILLFALSLIFGCFFSWQIGIPTLIFGLSLLSLYKMTITFKKLCPLSSFALGVVFSYTIYHPIHEAIHYLVAYSSGATITSVEWWFLTDSGFQNPHVYADFTSKTVSLVIICYIAPFVVLSIAFIALFFFWHIRKSPWIHFTSVPLALNLALSHDDLGLDLNFAIPMSVIVFFLVEFVALYYLWIQKKQAKEIKGSLKIT